MPTDYDQKLAEAYAAGRRAGIAEMQSAGIITDKGAAPLVGTGEMVVRPLLHILLCDGKVRGWTDNREWAEQWANQYYLRSFVSGVPELRQHNTTMSLGPREDGASTKPQT